MSEPAEKPVMRLSPWLAKILLAKSPLHAWDAHYLGGGAESEQTDAQTTGQVCEKLLLGTGPEIVEMDPTWGNYRTKAAQEAKAAALAEGKLPLLCHEKMEYDAIIEAWNDHLRKKGIEFKGKSQVKLEWANPESGTPCKGRPDHLIVDEASGIIYDLKSCTDASDEATDRQIVKYGYDVQHAAYLEGASLAYPQAAGNFKFLFIFAEVDRPWAVNVRPFGGSMAELGDRKWQRACRIWARCLKENRFPGYELQNPIEARAWQLEDDMQKQIASMGNDNATVPF